MLSNKLTFSLASLLIFLTAVFCFPVAAQTRMENLAPARMDANNFWIVGEVSLNARANLGVLDFGSTEGTQKYHLIFFPDLEAFFSAGGTIELFIDADIDIDPGPGVRKTAPGDFVISEIMWGLDAGGNPKQWIEIYNTTKFNVIFSSTRSQAKSRVSSSRHQIRAVLRFTPFTRVTHPLPDPNTFLGLLEDTNYIVSDTVSNVGIGGKWTMPGSSGVTTAPTNVADPAQSNLVSAYRNIDYAKVTGIHKLKADNTVDTAANRTEQLKGIPDGTLASSWKATPVAGSRNMARWHIGTPNMRHVPDTNFTFEVPKTSYPL